ncbi:MAG: T9SS type A sorting domain-containing protein [Candidatus Edwardsbacteria bacterium]|nr:T9SS type A sorting domain-containing protein [Candidatus Edwardsbacteria bacterium]
MKQSALIIILTTVSFWKPAAGQPAFKVTTVDTNVNHAAAIAVADLNRDGIPDLVAASWGNPPSSADYKGIRYSLGSDSAVSSWSCLAVDSIYHPMGVEAADLDGDSLIDVAACGWVSNDLAWWGNDGNVPINWTRYAIDSNFTNAHEIHAADIDGDGDFDIFAAAAGVKQIAVWYNDGSQPPVWTKQVVDSAFGGARSVVAADFDGDGDLDLAGAALLIDQVAWWRNEGDSPAAWTKYVIDNTFDTAHRLNWVDLDLDGRADLVGAGYSGSIVWWRNTVGSPIDWVKQAVAPEYPGGMVAHAADMDGDGDIDIIGTNQVNDLVSVWTNEGGAPPAWTEYRWSYPGPWPILPYDLNGDGTPDMVTGGYYESSWFRNISHLRVSAVPGFCSLLPGDSTSVLLELPLRFGKTSAVEISAALEAAPFQGSISLVLDRTSLSSPDSCRLAITASPDASPGKYGISITTSDGIDTLTIEGMIEIEIIGQGQAACIGASQKMLALVRSVWSETDSLGSFPSSIGSNYQALIIESGAGPADSAKVRSFIENGGRALIMAETPYDLCAGTALAPISGWLGATTFAFYTGAGISIISNYNEPFGFSSVASGDTLGIAVSGCGRLSGLTANATSIAHLGSVSSAIAGAYCHYGSGHSFYYTGGAGISPSSDSLLAAYLKNPALGVGSVPGGIVLTARLLLKVKPNPMAGYCQIDLNLPSSGPADLSVYDIAGRKIATILHQPMAQGPHREYWDGRMAGGLRCASGVYFIRGTTPAGAATQKVLLLK